MGINMCKLSQWTKKQGQQELIRRYPGREFREKRKLGRSPIDEALGVSLLC